jgi:hypothetical protein
LQVLLKAIFLFVVLNVVLALITLYNDLVPGRLRFPYKQESAFYFVGFNAPIYEDYDAMFGAQRINTFIVTQPAGSALPNCWLPKSDS